MAEPPTKTSAADRVPIAAPEGPLAEAGVNVPPARTLHTTASLAAELGTSERTVRRAIETGELPATRRAGRWVMTAEDVCRWARTGREPVRRRSRRSDLPRPRARPTEGLAGVFAAQEADVA